MCNTREDARWAGFSTKLGIRERKMKKIICSVDFLHFRKVC